MALLNTAVFLASKGRRVLVVDFDLEAPSLPTYASLGCAQGTPGVVDFIAKFKDTNSAPDVSEYIAQCDLDEAALWVMPAGSATESYGMRLQAIDWADLYQNHNGFLLMEDLKEQWRALDFDYVLIDSRTGHTDVGGICTRQLPDLVVVMFVPNEQNISGLEEVVEGIRSERSRTGGKDISLLFCPSNVPDLDDEKGILKLLLEDASRRLKFNAPATIIHHYPSLDLLVQKPFVSYRPNAKLSHEYRELGSAVLASNLDDRDGALINIRRVLKELRNPDFRATPWRLGEFASVTSAVRQFHLKDAEIAYELSRIFSILGDMEGELDALSIAIEGGVMVEECLRRRGAILLQIGRREEGVRDLQEVISRSGASSIDVLHAAETLRSVSKDWVSAVEDSPAVRNLDSASKNSIIDLLLSSKKGLSRAIDLAEEIIVDKTTTRFVRTSARVSLSLALISYGEFKKALSVIGVSFKDIVRGGVDVVDQFNFAMASWGDNGEPPVEIFDLIARAASPSRVNDPNYNQCLAMANFVSGNTEKGFEFIQAARDAMESSGRPFSCWRYLYATHQAFLADLNAMELQAEKGRIQPPVLKARRITR